MAVLADSEALLSGNRNWIHRSQWNMAFKSYSDAPSPAQAGTILVMRLLKPRRHVWQSLDLGPRAASSHPPRRGWAGGPQGLRRQHSLGVLTACARPRHPPCPGPPLHPGSSNRLFSDHPFHFEVMRCLFCDWALVSRVVCARSLSRAALGAGQAASWPWPAAGQRVAEVPF